MVANLSDRSLLSFVGAFGSPVNIGEINGAFASIRDSNFVSKSSKSVFLDKSETALETNLFVAICSVSLSFAAVGAVGTPVNSGDARFAFALNLSGKSLFRVFNVPIRLALLVVIFPSNLPTSLFIYSLRSILKPLETFWTNLVVAS